MRLFVCHGVRANLPHESGSSVTAAPSDAKEISSHKCPQGVLSSTFHLPSHVISGRLVSNHSCLSQCLQQKSEQPLFYLKVANSPEGKAAGARPLLCRSLAWNSLKDRERDQSA